MVEKQPKSESPEIIGFVVLKIFDDEADRITE
jgi:hypothetical protein